MILVLDITGPKPSVSSGTSYAPERVQALLLDTSLREAGRFSLWVRQNTATPGANANLTERYGMRSRLVLGAVMDMVKSARVIAAFEGAMTDLALQCWRASEAKEHDDRGPWLRDRQSLVDLSAYPEANVSANKTMGLDGALIALSIPVVRDAIERGITPLEVTRAEAAE